MDLVLELTELAKGLQDDKKKLLIEVAKGFLHKNDDWDEVFDDDLHCIELAERELRDGTNPKWSDINWD